MVSIPSRTRLSQTTCAPVSLMMPPLLPYRNVIIYLSTADHQVSVHMGAKKPGFSLAETFRVVDWVDGYW